MTIVYDYRLKVCGNYMIILKLKQLLTYNINILKFHNNIVLNLLSKYYRLQNESPIIFYTQILLIDDLQDFKRNQKISTHFLRTHWECSLLRFTTPNLIFQLAYMGC